jgi:hypothetical protein
VGAQGCERNPAAVLVQVPRENVKPPPEALEVYTGVAAPKRKKVEEQPTVSEMPAVRFCASKREPTLVVMSNGT